MSYIFGAKSNAALAGVHPMLVNVARAAIAISAQDFTVYEGVRTLARQKDYVARGVSKTLASKHLKQKDGLGHAIDLVPWIGGQAVWAWSGCHAIAAAMVQAARAQGVADSIRWGGVWDRSLAQLGEASAAGMRAAVAAYCERHPGPDFIDGPHFEVM
jgi:peptidoglycan L-alanyl-D-glutamate endopeptidase CwlK